MKKLFALLIIFQLLSCGGINVSDIPLENVAEHKKIINENIEDKEALEKAYVELSVENDQVWESPYIYYYLELIYDDEYESLFDLDDLESGLVLFPNDPFLNNLKVNMDDNLDSSLEGYKNILENHPRFYAALSNINQNYGTYWNSLEDDKDIISEKKRVQNLLGLVNLYESGDNNTSEYYNFNEIFSDTIAYNYLPFDTIKSNFEKNAVSIKAAEERERERLREERERRIAARERQRVAKQKEIVNNFPGVYINYPMGRSNSHIRNKLTIYSSGGVFLEDYTDNYSSGNWRITSYDESYSTIAEFEILLDYLSLRGDIKSDGSLEISGLGNFKKFR
jgi:hypothetical protein